MIGEGGFRCVYNGFIKSPEDPSHEIEAAIRHLGRKGIQGHKEWVTEVNVLGVVEHPNLVKFLGYCAEDDERGIQRLLVYKYMIIFRDFKSSNILLDEQWNAKLSDFGLARLGPSEGLAHVSTEVVGTMGSTSPEYLQTGRLISKNDIWSYGVFLYELITGWRPLDRNRPKSEQKLLNWVKPYLYNTKKFKTIVDPRLKWKCSLKSVYKLSMVVNRCLVKNRKSHPVMSEVSEMVNKIVKQSDETRIGNPQSSRSFTEAEPAGDAEEAKKRSIIDWKITENARLGRILSPKLVKTH